MYEISGILANIVQRLVRKNIDKRAVCCSIKNIKLYLYMQNRSSIYEIKFI